MNIGDEAYRIALARWRELMLLKQKQKLTFRQAMELDALERKLDEAEKEKEA